MEKIPNNSQNLLPAFLTNPAPHEQQLNHKFQTYFQIMVNDLFYIILHEDSAKVQLAKNIQKIRLHYH